MPIDWRSFDAYQLHYLSEHPNFAVEINCKNQQQLVGRLRFLDTGQPQPPNGPGADGVLYVYYRLDRFADVLRLLQQETPLSMYVNDAGVGALSTGTEPVGEEES